MITFFNLDLIGDKIVGDEFHFELNSSKEEIKKFQAAVYSLLPNSVSSDIFAMSLHELIVNAAEHGNQMDKNKLVIVDLLLDEKGFYAKVEDQGRGFKWKNKIKKKFDICRDSDRGRGIIMTVKGCDDFYYNQKGNIAYLYKKNDF